MILNPLIKTRLLAVLAGIVVFQTCRADEEWRSLFNGRDLQGWDTWLASRKPKEPPLGLNNDRPGVFTVAQKDGASAIRISGEVAGAISTAEQFTNFHLRLEYKWGQKKWPPRHEPKHHRDSGVMYWSVGPYGAGSGAWMRSVQCNVMEKGTGQFWSVGGVYVDIEGHKVVLDNEPSIPYRGESPGEQIIVYEPGAAKITTTEGITPKINPEKTNDWNVCEVIAFGSVGIHILNGKVVLVLSNPRYREGGQEIALIHGKFQLQSEYAEIFYRNIEVRVISQIPEQYLSHVPANAKARFE